MWSAFIAIDSRSREDSWPTKVIATLLIHLRYLCGQGGSMNAEYAGNLRVIIEEILSNISSGLLGDNTSYCFTQSLDTFANRRNNINKLGMQALNLLWDHQKDEKDELANIVQHSALWLICGIISRYNAIDTDEKVGSRGCPGYTGEYYHSIDCVALMYWLVLR